MKKQLTVPDGSDTKPKSNLRISGVGWFLFVVILSAAVYGPILMNHNGIPQNITFVFLVIMILIAIYPISSEGSVSMGESRRTALWKIS